MGPGDVSGAGTGTLQSSLASGGRGSPGAGVARAWLVSNRSPRAAREVASNSGKLVALRWLDN